MSPDRSPSPFALAVALGLVVGASAAARGQDAGKAEPKARAAETAKPVKLEKATFGGGCFWCVEAVYERIPGVKTAVSGYAGGFTQNPTYEDVSSGTTGHAEVVQLEYDPAVVSYEKLLEIFFKSHDPTTLNAQGPDFGTQYRSVVFYHSEDQKRAAQAIYKKLTAARTFRDPIVTELVPIGLFYPAEAYHQDYYRTHRSADYCQMVIAPKLRKLKLK